MSVPELSLRGVPFERQVLLPVEFKGVRLECGYRLDLLIDKNVVVEIETVESLLPIHEAQLLTYLKLGGWKVGLLINFDVSVLKNGICRRVLNFEEQDSAVSSTWLIRACPGQDLL